MISFIMILDMVKMAASELYMKSVDSSPFSMMSRIGQAERSAVEFDMTDAIK